MSNDPAPRARGRRALLPTVLLTLAAGGLACSEPETPSPAPGTGGAQTTPAPGPAGGARGPGAGAAAGTQPVDPERAALMASPGFQPFLAAQQAVTEGDVDRGIELLESAVRADASRPEFFDGLYKLWIRKGDYPSAIAVLQRALERTPDRPDFWYNLGILEMRLGGFEQAEQCLLRATQLAPDMALAHFNLGYNHYQQGTLIVGGPTVDHERMKLALQSYDRALAFDPSFSDAYYWSGMAHLAMHEDDAALEDFQKAIEVGATRIGPYLEAADVLLQNDEVEEAERLYREAASVDVDWAQPYVGLGRIEERRGDYVAALRQYETAQAIDPELSGIYRGLASCYRRLGDEERAEEAQAKFDELSTEEKAELEDRRASVLGRRADDLYNTGIALEEAGRVDEAVIAYQKAIEANPEHSEALTQLGTLHQQRGEMEVAADFFKRALQADSNNLRAYRLLKEVKDLAGTLPMVDEVPPEEGADG